MLGAIAVLVAGNEKAKEYFKQFGTLNAVENLMHGILVVLEEKVYILPNYC